MGIGSHEYIGFKAWREPANLPLPWQSLGSIIKNGVLVPFSSSPGVAVTFLQRENSQPPFPFSWKISQGISRAYTQSCIIQLSPQRIRAVQSMGTACYASIVKATFGSDEFATPPHHICPRWMWQQWQHCFANQIACYGNNLHKHPCSCFFITSRPDIPAILGFGDIPGQLHRDFVFNDIELSTVDQDIAAYYHYQLSKLNLNKKNTSEDAFQKLVKKKARVIYPRRYLPSVALFLMARFLLTVDSHPC